MSTDKNVTEKVYSTISSDFFDIKKSDVDSIVSGIIGLSATNQQQLKNIFSNIISKINLLSDTSSIYQNQIINRLETLDKKFGVIISQNKSMEELILENNIFTEQFYQEHILEKLAAMLFPIIDVIEDTINSWLDNSLQIDAQMFELLKGLKTQLVHFFQIYQIEIIQNKPGVKFDAQIMRPSKIVQAANMELDKCVAKSLQAGFKCVKSGRLIRAESVIVYKY